MIMYPIHQIKSNLPVSETLTLEVIFFDPHQELVSHNKLHPETLVTSTPTEMTARTHFHVWYDLKTTLVKPSKYQPSK